MTPEKISRAALLRLYPNRAQAAALRRWQGGLRFVWNAMLDCVFTARSINGRWPTKAEIQSFVVGMKKDEATAWVAELPAHALLKLVDDFQQALKNWFDSLAGKRRGRKMGRPQFRGRYAKQFSVYMVNQSTTFLDGAVKLPKLGRVKMRGGDLPAGRLLSSRVYCEAGKWFMASVFECEAPEQTIAPLECVGIDMGLKTLATVFDGERITEVPKLGALRDKQRRLARYQRRMSRRVKDSKRRERAKAQVARLHQRIANARKDHAHKATTAIVERAQTIKVETLNVAGWMKNRSIAKSAADASVGAFLTMLRYKAEAAGRTLIEVGQWEPTSKTCSACGAHEPGVVLGVSQWACRACGVIHDRDHNAARNIFAYGEERRNVARVGAETRRESGQQDRGSPVPVPDDELRILKRTEQGPTHVLV